MNLVRRLFPFRTCTIDIKDGVRALQRPCLLYHIKRCQGPCIQAIDKDAYRADITQIELFLEGRQETLVKALRSEMAAASEQQAYERAAALRDKVKAIERTMESQKMAGFARTELDVLGLARQDNQAAVQLFTVRDGKLLGRDVFLLDAMREAHRRRGPHELRGAVLRARELHPPGDPRPGRAQRDPGPRGVPGRAARRARPPARPAPGRQARAHGARRPQRRARRSPASRPAGWPTRAGRWAPSRSSPRPSTCPGRRCASSATTSARSRAPSRSAAWSSSRRAGRGRASTAASGSRRSRARTTSPATRRCSRAGSGGPGRRRGQRRGAPLEAARPGHHRRREGPGRAPPRPSSTSSACTTCRSSAWPRSARSSSCPAPSDPILLPATSGALYLVQRLRDEAHRFAITYHRDLRAKASVRSAFDDLPGVGPKRKRALLRVFGSAKRVREAPVEQIAAVPGIGPRLAATIKETLEA